MKLMRKLTLRYLKENKKRTILSILCITVSVIMMSCIGISFSSGKQYYKEYLEKREGPYHYVIGMEKYNPNLIQYLNDDKEIDYYYFHNNEFLNYNQKKMSFLINKGDNTYFDLFDLSQYVIEGRLPQNKDEIALTKTYLKIFDIGDKKIGDTLTFDNQKSYKIVGFMDSYQIKYEIYHATSYIDLDETGTNIYIVDKDVSSYIFEHSDEIMESQNISFLEYHSGYLAIQDVFEQDTHSLIFNIYSLIGLLIIIVMVVSYFIIYQAFHLSIYDRIQYLGMLSSVGATSRQKRYSIYFEGLILSFIAIPLGLLISYGGLSVTFMFINQLDILKSQQVSIHTYISLKYLLLVISLSFLTIFISLIKPAYHISKISVIDALRKNDEIHVKNKKLKRKSIFDRGNHIYQKLAIKNYRRQGKQTHIIIFSLVLSMALFISILSTGSYLIKTIHMRESQAYNYDIYSFVNDDEKEIMDQYLKDNPLIQDYICYKEFSLYAQFDENYFDDLEDHQIKEENGYYDVYVKGINLEKYQEICQENGIEIKDNQGLIVNNDHTFKKVDKNLIQTLYYEEEVYDGNDHWITLPKQYVYLDDLQEISLDIDDHGYDYIIILPIDVMMSFINNHYEAFYYYEITSDRHEEITNQLIDFSLNAYDYTQNQIQSQQFFMIASIFVYGFIIIMIFFALLNIINIMIASIEKRKKEFGMLLSMGMSLKNMKKMIFYESLIYGMKTILYGIPLSSILEYILYQTLDLETSFSPNYIAYFLSLIMILFVMVLTFYVGLNRFQKQNIIETLKDDI